jgi:hypothetical protein
MGGDRGDSLTEAVHAGSPQHAPLFGDFEMMSPGLTLNDVVHKNHHMSFGRVSDHSLQIRKSQYF